MARFESRKSRNMRLFQTVWRFLLRRLHESVSDEYAQVSIKVYGACLFGGSVAANFVVDECESVRKVWGKGDEKKALALTELFTLCIVSQQCKWHDEKGQFSKNERRQIRENKALDILTLFGDESENALESFMNMDMQFNYEENDMERLFHFNSLLLAKACEACGQPRVDWSKVTFPVKQLGDLVKSGAVVDARPFMNPDELLTIQLAFVMGVEAMSKYYKETGND